MSALLDTALAWLLWTSVSWATLALGMAVWFRLRPPQTATVRHAALAAVILAGTLVGLLPRWGSGVVAVTATAVEAPTVVTPQPVEMEAAGNVAAVSNSSPRPAASAREVEPLIPGRDRRGRPFAGLEAGARDIEPPVSAIIPAVVNLRDWYAHGKSVFATAWLLGALFLGVRLVRAVRMTQRWRREARPLPDGEQAVFATLWQELQVRRATRAGSHDEPAAPLVLCGWPPLVVVPGDWSIWDDRSRGAAWRHELAHVRRCDDWWRMLSEVLRVVWWFHPGMRWLLSRREHEAELLSDEAAVAAGCPPQELAQVLLDACRRWHSEIWTAPAGTFFSPRTMKVRIARLVEATSAEALCRPAPRGLRIAACAGIVLLALFGSMRWIAAANETHAAPVTDETTTVAVMPVADQPAPPIDSAKQEPAPVKERPNYVKVIGRLLDADTGKPIERASWESGMADPKNPAKIAWGHSRKFGGTYPDGKFEELVHFTPDGHFDRLRVYAAGYETTIVINELPNPRPLQLERVVKLMRGRTVTGTLRDHTGKPVANGWVFFIPAGHRSNIVEGLPGTDTYQLPRESRDGAVAEVRTDTQGQFVLSTGSAGTLAASTDAVDLWPFPLADDGHADLKMPEPAHLVIDLTYWYLDELARKDKRALSPDSEDPNQCWIQVDRPGELNGLWKGLEYHRQMLVFALDPRAKLSKGVSIGQVREAERDQPIPGEGHNKNIATTIRIALPPGNYRVQRLRAGPFAPVDEQTVELKSGAETTMSCARSDGAAVRGKVTWPENMMFVRQPGDSPRKLDWTVPDMATVTIAKGKRIEAAKIQPDGSFFVATHLEPGRYELSATVYLPEHDFRGGYRGADCVATQELVIPEPLRRPSGSPPVKVELAMHVSGPRFVPAKAPADDPPKKEAASKAETSKLIQVTGQLLDDATGKPIERAFWELGFLDPKQPDGIAWGFDRGDRIHVDGKFTTSLFVSAQGVYNRMRVTVGGYETAVLIGDLPQPVPDSVERIVRLKRSGKTVSGTVRDHQGQPAAGAQVYFIPKGHRASIAGGYLGPDLKSWPIRPRRSNDALVAETVADDEGRFTLPLPGPGTLAASTKQVDVWPFPLPADGQPANLNMPAPATLVVDLDEWRLDGLYQKSQRVRDFPTSNPDEYWMTVVRYAPEAAATSAIEQPWASLSYERKMLIFAPQGDPRIARDVAVGEMFETSAAEPIPGIGFNKRRKGQIRVALPPGKYSLTRLHDGPFGFTTFVLKPGEETIFGQWKRPAGAAVRGTVKLPENMQFVRQPGEAPRKLDWTIPYNGGLVDIQSNNVVYDSVGISGGSFIVPTHLPPGKYAVRAFLNLPLPDFDREGHISGKMPQAWRDLGGLMHAPQELVIPEPALGPAGSPPVEIELIMKAVVGEQIVAAPPKSD